MPVIDDSWVSVAVRSWRRARRRGPTASRTSSRAGASSLMRTILLLRQWNLSTSLWIKDSPGGEGVVVTSQTSGERHMVNEKYDVVVVGGGTAGLGAALTLGRARRTVLVIDAGAPRNAPAGHVHNYLGREGTP